MRIIEKNVYKKQALRLAFYDYLFLFKQTSVSTCLVYSY